MTFTGSDHSPSDLSRCRFCSRPLGQAAYDESVHRNIDRSPQEKEDMNTVNSKDGTRIAFDRVGKGPALIILGGFPDRTANMGLASLLASDFTVINYDRRGHGESGDTPPFTADREFEDLEALIAEAGGSVFIYSTSGGGIIALEAVARGLNSTKLAVWEPPFIVDDSRPPLASDYRTQLTEMIATGRRGDAVELFFTQAVGMPAEFVAPMRQSPFWAGMENVAHTLVYDAELVGDFSLPVDQIATVKIPTLVVDGGFSPWMTSGANALAAALPNAERRTLAGQPHNVAADAIAPVLIEFFNR
jgi:pimeloyl-ACP methyl ester carboxylesterase